MFPTKKRLDLISNYMRNLFIFFLICTGCSSAKNIDGASLPIDSIIREYQNEYSSIMSTIYPNDSCEYSLSMIVNSKLYYTFILYNWEGTTHLTIWGDPAIPTPLLRYYKFYAYKSPNELFFCEIGDSIPENVKESLMRGLNIEPCNDHAVSEWDGDPFLIDFLFDNGSWKKVDQGFDKVGFWFQVSKQYNNKNIEWK